MDVTDVWNMALGICGAQGRLTSTADRTREAEVCATHYEHVRRMVFRAAWWPSIRNARKLTLAAERNFNEAWDNGDPLRPYRYAYNLPSDIIAPRHLDDYSRFELSPHEGLQRLHTMRKNAILLYTYDEANPDVWDISLVDLVAATLAQRIAPTLRVDAAREKRVKEHFERAYSLALTQQANLDDTPLPEQVPDWIAARGYDLDLHGAHKYSYPVTPLSFPSSPGVGNP